jgi:hypothetical protein
MATTAAPPFNLVASLQDTMHRIGNLQGNNSAAAFGKYHPNKAAHMSVVTDSVAGNSMHDIHRLRPPSQDLALPGGNHAVTAATAAATAAVAAAASSRGKYIVGIVALALLLVAIVGGMIMYKRRIAARQRAEEEDAQKRRLSLIAANTEAAMKRRIGEQQAAAAATATAATTGERSYEYVITPPPQPQSQPQRIHFVQPGESSIRRSLSPPRSPRIRIIESPPPSPTPSPPPPAAKNTTALHAAMQMEMEGMEAAVAKSLQNRKRLQDLKQRLESNIKSVVSSVSETVAKTIASQRAFSSHAATQVYDEKVLLNHGTPNMSTAPLDDTALPSEELLDVAVESHPIQAVPVGGDTYSA